MFSRQKSERKLKKRDQTTVQIVWSFVYLYILYLQNAVTLFELGEIRLKSINLFDGLCVWKDAESRRFFAI